MQKKLILVDDHKMILHGLTSYIEKASTWNVVFSATSKCELQEKLEVHKNDFLSETPDEPVQIVALLDINVGNDDGYELGKILREKIPSIRCIMYSMYCTYGNIMFAFENGAQGFLSKDSDETELILALDAVGAGKTYLQQDLMQKVIENTNKISLLTVREKQVFDLVCEGKTKKEISHDLKVSIRTCENYFSILYSKLGLTGFEDLVSKFGGGH